jgi:hypothetical protein
LVLSHGHGQGEDTLKASIGALNLVIVAAPALLKPTFPPEDYAAIFDLDLKIMLLEAWNLGANDYVLRRLEDIYRWCPLGGSNILLLRPSAWSHHHIFE